MLVELGINGFRHKAFWIPRKPAGQRAFPVVCFWRYYVGCYLLDKNQSLGLSLLPVTQQALLVSPMKVRYGLGSKDVRPSSKGSRKSTGRRETWDSVCSFWLEVLSPSNKRV